MTHKPQRLLVTGGSGFIGSSFIRYVLTHQPACTHLLNLDLLTYAANPENVKPVQEDPRYHFIQGDIRDQALTLRLVQEHAIDTIVHFAAATHVDQSIADPMIFYSTNVGGTLSLLEAVRRHPHIHFHHISTDEVYGSLEVSQERFSEKSPYNPSSPYSASKAAADHFVRAYTQTYGISTTISHCTNNYGPCQHAEKLIPKVLSHLFYGRPIPIYGTGKNIRDWLFVDDHSSAIWKILDNTQKQGTYGIGGSAEYTNIDLTHLLIELFAQCQGKSPSTYQPLVTFVTDRLGHDLRYAIDAQKIIQELQWTPAYDLRQGLHTTVQWYLNHPERLHI